MSSPAQAPRLNPFGFPSNIDFYLILIIVSALAGTLFVFNWLWFGIPGNVDRFDQAIAECGGVSPVGLLDMAGQDLGGVQAIANASNAALLCRADLETEVAIFMAAGALILVVVAAGIYFSWPARKRRSGNFQALGEEDAPEVSAYLSELSAEAGVSRIPAFLWNPLNANRNALVFGFLGRYSLALSGGLVTQYYADRPTFRAIVFHELAHLRNKDVDKTYITLSVWQAFVVAGLAPLAIGILSGFIGSLAVFLQIAWRIALLTLLVYLSRNAVLRARELYADVRASVWDGPEGALKGALENLPERSTSRLQSLFRKHPATDERSRMLSDTGGLFKMSAWTAFATGLIAMIAFPSLWKWLSIATSGLADVRGGSSITMVTALIVSPFIVGVVGIGVWRMTFASWASSSQRLIRVGGLALALTLGLLLGELASFESFINLSVGGYPYLVFRPSSGLGLVLAYLALVILSGLLLLAIVAFLGWISTGSIGWLEVAAWSRSPRPAYWVAFTVGSVLFTLLLGAFINLRELVTSLAAEIVSVAESVVLITVSLLALPVYFLEQPLTLLALTLLWAFPFSAWLVLKRREPASTSPWVYLDRQEPPPSLSSSEPVRLRFSLTRGLYAGILFSVMLLIARFLLILVLPEDIRLSDTYKLIFFFSQVVIAMGMQAVLAAVVAYATQMLRFEHGLFSAFVGGVAMTIGILGINLAFGGALDASFGWQTLSLVVSGGAVASILVILLLYGLQRVISVFRAPRPAPALET